MELLMKDSMGEYEKEKGRESYKTIVEYFVGDIVLCNRIIEVDQSVYDNAEFDWDEEIYQ